MRKQIAAANWKMNLTIQQAETLVSDLLSASFDLNQEREVVFAVPFPYLVSIQNIIAGKEHVSVAAQNCYNKLSGAYTGEVSAEMLKSIGVPYVIIGHSERREYFNETNAVLAEKVSICFEYGLKPIFCCGEALSIREAGTQNSHVENQLKESLFHLTEEHLTGFVIAYEPIWAIGTGKTATSEQAQEMHAHIRKVLATQYSEALANSISILYGGSVKAANAKEIFGQPDVDGGLVGGSSLIATEFSVIINSLK
ncbi:MAG: triose-phosphate isomerase [Ferruginibacter sp.]|nr:triose-phosphate isomerase [Ferruginibacter sp.]